MLDDPPAKLALVDMRRENIVPNEERQRILFKHTWSVSQNCPCIDKENNRSWRVIRHRPHLLTAMQCSQEPVKRNIFRKSTSEN